MRLLGHLWALPGSLAGVVYWLVCGPWKVWTDGALWCQSRRLWGLPRWVDAVTLGSVVVCRAPPDPKLRAHELVHVRQWGRWGVLFPLAYGAASLYALAWHGAPYEANVFEAEARRAAT